MDNGHVLPAENAENLPAVIEIPAPKTPFHPDTCDFVFALCTLALGYLFSRWVFFAWRGWGVFVFTTAYLFTCYAYLAKRGLSVSPRENPAALFWSAITWLTGLSYALWDGSNLYLRGLFLFCSAVYFVLTASGRAIMGSTGNYLLIDGINAVFIIPFRNFLNQYISFSVLRRSGSGHFKKTLPVLTGILLALLMVVWLIPPLLRADSGGFTKIFKAAAGIFRFDSSVLFDFLLYAAFSIPMSAYIYGLISGMAHNRSTRTISPDGAKKTVAALRIVQPATIYIALGTVCLLYIVFILSQLPYFFSAFTGTRPEGWLVYSEYAREGFFELCRIAAVNLAVLAACNITCVKKRSDSRVLKTLNIALALKTLLLIATALSKMALYIGVYGLSMRRLLPCVFMLFLSVVFAAVIVLQKKDFSIVRFALISGAIMFCSLCLINPDAIVAGYNTERYLSGTLSACDVSIFYSAGAAGILPAVEVFENTENTALRLEIIRYLSAQKHVSGSYKAHEMSYERHRAAALLGEVLP